MRFFSVAVLVGSVALSGCFEVENGPAFSGGDEVPGLEGTLYPYGRISPTEGPNIQPIDDSDVNTWHVRRALNGSYIMTADGDPDEDDMILRPRLISGGDYVIEYSSESDENFLGVLTVEGRSDQQLYYFCISLEWDDDEIVALGPAHNVLVHDPTYGSMSLSADNPADLFAFMADLRGRTEIGEWECTVMTSMQPQRRTKG